MGPPQRLNRFGVARPDLSHPPPGATPDLLESDPSPRKYHALCGGGNWNLEESSAEVTATEGLETIAAQLLQVLPIVRARARPSSNS